MFRTAYVKSFKLIDIIDNNNRIVAWYNTPRGIFVFNLNDSYASPFYETHPICRSLLTMCKLYGVI